MSTIPVALQLYSVRDDCSRGLSEVFEALANMGYAGVEFAGYYGYDAIELRKLLDDYGLLVAGTHIGLDTLTGDSLKQTIEFNQILGNKFLIVPGLSDEYTASKSAWLSTAHLFNQVAEQLLPDGLRIGYHNHTTEFTALDGELPWDVFFRNTSHGVVMQLDTGNAMAGGGDPIACLTDYPGRAATLHLKEFSATNPSALLGEGGVLWATVFEKCEAQGETEWYIVEQETYKYPPLETAKKCLENLRQMGR